MDSHNSFPWPCAKRRRTIADNIADDYSGLCQNYSEAIMRSAVLWAVGCLICVSQAAFAYETVTMRFSRPDTSYYTFLDDRTTCLKTTSRTQFALHYAREGEWTTYHIPEFANCMKGKGYVRDPNGYKALRYLVWLGGYVTLLPLDDRGR
jgi:hypothetical protein